MSWFKLDDKSTFHRKVVAAGNAAWGAFCRLGTHSSDQGTDGVVSWRSPGSSARRRS